MALDRPAIDKPVRYSFLHGDRVPLRERLAFFTQMSTMLRSGLNVAQSLAGLRRQVGNPMMQYVIAELLAQIERGMSLSSAMEMFPNVFDSRTVALAAAGEESGGIDDALEGIAAMLDRQKKIRRRIRSAMFYPSFVIVFAIVVLIVFSLFVMPKFQHIFEVMNVKIPWLTSVVFAIGGAFAANIVPIAVLAAAAVAGWMYLSGNPSTKPTMDRLKIKLPIVRVFIYKSAMARTTMTLSTLLGAGVSMLKSLELTRNVADNVVIAESYEALFDAAQSGRRLSDTAEQSGVFQPVVVQMLSVGEDTGQLEHMLKKTAEWYDEDLSEFADRMTAYMEPLMILLIGVVVGFIAMAVFGPIAGAVYELSKPKG